MERIAKFELERSLKGIYSSFTKNKDGILNEESTKMSLIVPFFRSLGYNVFNPEEFRSEYVADVGIKNGEKVDYCVMRGNVPLILIECKHHKEKNLDKHVSQLFRYFVVTTAKLGILTNGVEYRFYSDTKQINIMDKEPFYIFRLNSFSDFDLDVLEMFTADNYKNENIALAIRVISAKIREDELEKKILIEEDNKIDLFFSKQEEYINKDYANLLYNLLFDRDIHSSRMNNVIEKMKSACIKSKSKQNTSYIAPREVEKKVDNKPIVNINQENRLSLYDVVIDRVDLSFTKISRLDNTRSGKVWEINSWGTLLETLVVDLIDSGMNRNELFHLDGLESDDGWIRNVPVENRLTTQKFKEVSRGVYLNTYGNAVAMVQKLYKVCIDYPQYMKNYNITLIKSNNRNN